MLYRNSVRQFNKENIARMECEKVIEITVEIETAVDVTACPFRHRHDITAFHTRGVSHGTESHH
jgi:hypothetical protein